jgi:hypothetical protein
MVLGMKFAALNVVRVTVWLRCQIAPTQKTLHWTEEVTAVIPTLAEGHAQFDRSCQQKNAGWT